ncbi:RNA-binding protein with serine-rich domain 1 [Heterocephalus glaber]|uniref:RNA-binding protein with serine-rich domain 1 n=1 Tax=Heterocephalus glaber TaxID=10181 RepID=G5BC24_HETGA|nr:RNA-binding protein with serine-rich domain 1 [Heterocephalus glaber]
MAPSPTKCKERSDEKSKDSSKDKGATKDSREKVCGRDESQKKRKASSGSSSTRSRPSSTSRSGSRTSTGSSSGSSSSSASSHSGSSSPSRSSSSSSFSGSLSPSRRRHNNNWPSCSKSKPPERDEKASPSPKPIEVRIRRLTRNVTKAHIMEIFSTYGKIKMMGMPVERMHPHLPKAYAYVEFENPDEAEKALKHMDGGPIDGQEILATAVLAPGLGPHPGDSALPGEHCHHLPCGTGHPHG